MPTFHTLIYLMFGALPATCWALMAVVFIGGAAVHAPEVNGNVILGVIWVLASIAGAVGLWAAAFRYARQDRALWDRMTMYFLAAGIFAMAPILYREHDGFNPAYGNIAMLASMWGPLLVALHFLLVRVLKLLRT